MINNQVYVCPTCIKLFSRVLSSSSLAVAVSWWWVCLRCSMADAWMWFNSDLREAERKEKERGMAEINDIFDLYIHPSSTHSYPVLGCRLGPSLPFQKFIVAIIRQYNTLTLHILYMEKKPLCTAMTPMINNWINFDYTHIISLHGMCSKYTYQKGHCSYKKSSTILSQISTWSKSGWHTYYKALPMFWT